MVTDVVGGRLYGGGGVWVLDFLVSTVEARKSNIQKTLLFSLRGSPRPHEDALCSSIYINRRMASNDFYLMTIFLQKDYLLIQKSSPVPEGIFYLGLRLYRAV